MFHKFSNPAGKSEFSLLVGPLIFQRNFQAFVKERELAEALRKRVVAVHCRGKDLWVSVKRNFRTGLSRFTGSLELGSGHTLFVRLLPHFAVAPDFQVEPV